MPLPDNLIRNGQHRHYCSVCEFPWWHDPGEDPCDETWVWTCPIDTGLTRDSVEAA
jgi:hypothetical protein